MRPAASRASRSAICSRMSATSRLVTSPAPSNSATAASGSSVWTWTLSVASSPTTRTESPRPSSRGRKSREARPAAGDDEVGAVAEAAVLVVGQAAARRLVVGDLGQPSSSPRRPATTPARIRTRPWPPASTTPDSRSTSSCSGVRSTARSPSSIARSRTSARTASCCSSLTSRPSRCLSASRWASWRVERVGHLAEDGQHRPLGRLAHRVVGGVGGAGEGGGDQHRVDQLAGAAGQLLGGAADDLAEDHAGVAAGAHQRRPGQRLDQLGAVDLVDLQLVEAVELLHHGAHRHRHVVAGVAIGDREDVEVVDLLASRLERGVGGADDPSEPGDRGIGHLAGESSRRPEMLRRGRESALLACAPNAQLRHLVHRPPQDRDHRLDRRPDRRRR